MICVTVDESLVRCFVMQRWCHPRAFCIEAWGSPDSPHEPRLSLSFHFNEKQDVSHTAHTKSHEKQGAACWTLLICFWRTSWEVTKTSISQRATGESVNSLLSAMKSNSLNPSRLSFKSAIRCCHRLRMLRRRHWISTMATPWALNDGRVVVNWH